MQSSLRAAEFDALIVGGPDNHRYFSGLDGIATVRPIFLIIPALGDAGFVSPRIEAPEIRSQTTIPVTVEWVEWVEPEGTPLDFSAALEEQLGLLALAGRRVAIDLDSVSAAAVSRIQERMPDLEISSAASLLLEQKKVKDQETLGIVRACAEIAVTQYEAASSAMKPGTTEWEIAMAARDAGIRLAAQFLGDSSTRSPLINSFQIVTSGTDRLARPHAAASMRKINDGELVQLCFCGRPFLGHGICFDRPVLVGEGTLPPELRKLIGVAERAQAAALDAVRPGAVAGDVHAASVEVFQREGLHRHMRHRTGRGIGLSDPEPPEIKGGDPTRLEPGMILAIEPGVYVDEVGGARFGDTVLVTEDGWDPITPVDRGHEVSGV
jgi:Xaa-Pro aminopeptidase